ncbi:MAG: hypothetical protein KatS3mg110_2641 [Pirellulaceae bacterium]|nr:MAG: hypothetical protein KatS3mg110_2641 [Pirellulaceae bacterium]
MHEHHVFGGEPSGKTVGNKGKSASPTREQRECSLIEFHRWLTEELVKFERRMARTNKRRPPDWWLAHQRGTRDRKTA